jgi:hypothetical protein
LCLGIVACGKGQESNLQNKDDNKWILINARRQNSMRRTGRFCLSGPQTSNRGARISIRHRTVSPARKSARGIKKHRSPESRKNQRSRRAVMVFFYLKEMNYFFFATGFFVSAFLATGFLTAAFLTTGFLTAGFLTATFLIAGFLTAAFLTAGFFTAGFLTATFLTAGFFTAGFLTAGFFAAGFAATCGVAVFFAAGFFVMKNAILFSYYFYY